MTETDIQKGADHKNMSVWQGFISQKI